jgi:hypothetical protein
VRERVIYAAADFSIIKSTIALALSSDELDVARSRLCLCVSCGRIWNKHFLNQT